jgi:lysozyme
MLDTAKLLERLKRKEGFERYVYSCPAGKLTVGFGRNLEDVGLTEEEASYLLENDMLRAFNGVRRSISWFDRLDGVRQACLVEMAFNLGLTGLLRFHNTLAALARGHWDEAAIEALDSKWARQVGKRAEEIAEMFKTGEWIC